MKCIPPSEKSQPGNIFLPINQPYIFLGPGEIFYYDVN